MSDQSAAVATSEATAPRGVARCANFLSGRSRNEKWELFQSFFPTSTDVKVVDVGVSSLDTLPGENYFLRNFPQPQCLTAVGIQDLGQLQGRFPAVTFVQADGRVLPFDDRSFGVVHSNAVVEHVGPLPDQRKFIHELCRVGEAGFVTTPDRWFPFETHTHLPFVHWFPRPVMLALQRLFGRVDSGFWLLSRRRFRSLFPADVSVELHCTRIAGLPASLVAVFRHQ